MPLPRELRPDDLAVLTDPQTFPFETTSELTEPAEIVGQERAVESIRFAMGIRQDGYNLFALGPPGTGKRFIVQHFLERQSTGRPAPPDICYVNNFDDPTQPRALSLAGGTGLGLRQDVEALLDDLAATLPALFESDEYHAQLQAAERQVKQHHDRKLATLQKDAESRLNWWVMRRIMPLFYWHYLLKGFAWFPTVRKRTGQAPGKYPVAS